MRRTDRKSALAERDLIGIWEYSCEQWDADQADNHLDELDRGVGLLADNPKLGVSREVVREGYRALIINSHAIYYTFAPSVIYIVRVLHVRMDPGQYL